MGSDDGLALLLGDALGVDVGLVLGAELGISGQFVLVPMTCTSAKERYTPVVGMKIYTPTMFVLTTPLVSQTNWG